MWDSSWSRRTVIAASTTIFVVSCVLPLAYMVAASVATIQHSTSAAGLLLDTRQRNLLFTTTMLGLGTAVFATAIGAPLGVALARIEVRSKAAWRVLLAAPMLLPPYVLGLAWVSLAGPTGLLADVVSREVLSAWTYSLPGAILVLALVLYPVSMLATEMAVRRIEPHLEEAALIIESPLHVLWHITLRLAAPAILAAALMIFVLAISEFAVPGLLQVRVFTTEVFTAFAALYDFGRATVLTLPLLLLSTVIAAVAVAVVGDQLVTTRRGTANGEVPLFQIWKRASVVVGALVIMLALVLPVALLMREAATVRSWRAVVEGSSSAMATSVLFATISATVTTAIGFGLGYARARGPRRLGVLTDLACVVLFAVPSTVVGVGLIGLWNRSGPLGAVYGTSAMLVLVSLARFLPVAALGMAAAVRQVPASHEEAAATAGAGWGRTIAFIVMPQVLPGALAVWVVVFVLAFGELGASILVAPPGEGTLPIRIYTLIANAPPAQVATLAILQTAVILAPLVLLAWIVAARKLR